MNDVINFPVSLYFDLEENKTADLRTIANAALEWDKLIKEISLILDPASSIRVELISGEEGSLWLRALIKASTKIAKQHPHASAMIVAVATTFLMTPLNHSAEEIWKEAYSVAGITWEKKDVISDKDAEKIASLVVDMSKNKVAVTTRSRIYSGIKEDPAIKGVGSSNSIKEKPKHIIARSHFDEMSKTEITEEETITRRVTDRKNVHAILVRPVLIAEPKQWRFEKAGKPFSATMNDKDFLHAIQSGNTGIELGQNVEMILNMTVTEEKKHGVWQISSISIDKVSIPESKSQSSFHFDKH